jgi:quaternary ammonium compound-resistance protein SugE
LIIKTKQHEFHTMTVSWIILLLAGVFEIGWPLGLKLADKPAYAVFGPIIAVISMAISGTLLWYALKEIPIGTAYAVWTGIGAAGTFLVGIAIFGDPTSLLRWAGVAAIVSGVVMLKFGSA